VHSGIVWEGQGDRAETIGGADEEGLRASPLDVLADWYLVYLFLTCLLLSFAYLITMKKTDDSVT